MTNRYLCHRNAMNMKTEIQDSSSSYFILLQLAVLDLIELLGSGQKKSIRKWNKKVSLSSHGSYHVMKVRR